MYTCTITCINNSHTQARAKLPKKRRRVVNVDVSEVRRNRNRSRAGTTKLSMPKLGMGSKLGKILIYFIQKTIVQSIYLREI